MIISFAYHLQRIICNGFFDNVKKVICRSIEKYWCQTCMLLISRSIAKGMVFIRTLYFMLLRYEKINVNAFKSNPYAALLSSLNDYAKFSQR